MGSLSANTARNEYAFPLSPDEYAPAPTPGLSEWQTLWKCWDLVTRDMIPAENLHTKPIPLRNDLIFYLGHIPTFEDIHLSRALREDPTPPSYYQIIFERGIDPDVDNPDQCHDHSEIPDQWPVLQDILDFQRKVRTRIASLYKNGKVHERIVQRALWIGFEHECLHLETFLYMTIQSDAIKPPPNIQRPNFQAMAIEAQRQRVDNEWIRIDVREAILGINPTDLEDEEVGPERYYAWDNERPLRKVPVSEFEAKARPITNEEYVIFMIDQGIDIVPATWIKIAPNHVDSKVHMSSSEFTSFVQDKAIRTVFGPVPLQYALDWPIMASFDELKACARWLGADIPSLNQVRCIQQQVERDQRQMKSIEQPTTSLPNPFDIFVNMEGSNVGFNYFHPTPVTQNGQRLSSPLGGLGGAWEQTSTLCEWYDGFKPMDIYPGYTADFLDSKHLFVVGGSWATHPRITGRKSFLNWWQPNYVYPWVTARLVRSVSK